MDVGLMYVVVQVIFRVYGGFTYTWGDIYRVDCK